MVYRAKDIKHLETMKNLEESQPQEVDVKSLFYSDASEGVSFEENILKLCSGLRIKGFEKLASSLEQKFVAFKQAEVHLYRVHDEDGEDLIDRAHPDGDTNMADGELGDVETIVSQHKKIVDVMDKKPTGKLASYIDQCRVILAQAVGMPGKDIAAGLASSLKELSDLRNKIERLRNFPEIQNDENVDSQFDQAWNAASNLVTWATEEINMASGAAQRATTLSPSKGLVSVQDVNTVTQDQRYQEFANILTATKNPSEIFQKFAGLVNFVKTRTLQIANSIQNEEVKKNALAQLSGPSSKLPTTQWAAPTNLGPHKG